MRRTPKHCGVSARTVILFGLLAWSGLARAAAPAIVNVQGVIRDALGDPVDGTFNLTFALYDAESDGTDLWSELQAAVPVDIGVFSALLGADGENPLPAEAMAVADELWVQVQLGSDTPLPRQRLVSAAYAIEAQHAVLADAAEALHCTACVSIGQLGFDPATQDELNALAVDPLAGLSCDVGQGLMFNGSDWGCSAVGDITAVATFSGSGLQGGGFFGDIELSIAPGGIAGAMIADGAITNADIAPTAAIAQSKIAGVIGDLTSVTTPSGGGLAGGGASGDLTLTLVACADREVIESDGRDWACTSQVYDSERLGSQTESAYFRLDQDETVTGAPTFAAIPSFNGGVSGSTAPFRVDSTTVVRNLNAELFGGRMVADFPGGAPLQVPRANTLTTLDNNRFVSAVTATTIGTDGRPVIAYHDSGNGNLMVAKCGDAVCAGPPTISTVDNSAMVGWDASIAIGSEGYPIISYFDDTNNDLKVAKCRNAACSGASTLSTIDAAGNVGARTSIAIGIDGLPVVSYWDYTSFDLKVAKCGDTACSYGNTVTTVDSTGFVGMDSSIAIGTDGLPVISYCDHMNGDLKIAKCGNAACSAGNTLSTVDSIGTLGLYTSATIGADGLPVISYYDETNDNLKVAKCGDAACSAGNTLSTVDSTGSVGGHTSITIGSDGLPVISYYDQTNRDLRFAKCGNIACSAGNTLTTVESAGDVGTHSSISIGTDGLPVIAYVGDERLRVAKCANPFCLPYWSRR